MLYCIEKKRRPAAWHFRAGLGAAFAARRRADMVSLSPYLQRDVGWVDGVDPGRPDVLRDFERLRFMS